MRQTRGRMGAGLALLAVLAVGAVTVADAPRGPRAARHSAGSPSIDPGRAAPEPPGREPRPGDPGIGDSYFPGYGNGGYDVHHYALRVRYDPGSDRLTGRAELDATATHALSRFNLDFDPLDIGTLRVDGVAATWQRQDDRELVVTPSVPVESGRRFRVEVEYAGVPRGESFRHTGDGALVLGQPQSATTWFPVNDHPRDKATYDVEVTVPDGLTAISNGIPRGSTVAAGWRTWRWSATSPMASYLTTLVIGRFRVFEGTFEGRPVFSAVDERLPAGGNAERAVRRSAEVAAFLATRFGPYPFEALGGVVTGEAGLPFALETQTRPVYAPSFFDGEGVSVVVHELAHQWFGDSVSVSQWRDIWLNEGFATYAEWLWAEHDGGRTAQQAFDAQYAAGPQARVWRPAPGDPGPEGLFAASVYVRGAMAVHALRVTVGDEVFFRLLPEWTASRAGGTAAVGDLLALAERLSGRQLDTLFRDWLYTEAKPPRPAAA